MGDPSLGACLRIVYWQKCSALSRRRSERVPSCRARTQVDVSYSFQASYTLTTWTSVLLWNRKRPGTYWLRREPESQGYHSRASQPTNTPSDDNLLASLLS